MKYKLIKRCSTGLFAIVVAALCVFDVQAAPDAPADIKALPRIDVPVTKANSVLWDFGYGATLRVPKILLSPSLIPADPNQPIAYHSFSFVFQFPDMLPAQGSSTMAKIFDQIAGRYTPQTDRFPVVITRLFYSEGELGNIPWKDAAEKVVPDWRPKSMLRNNLLTGEEYAIYKHVEPPPKPTLVDSKYAGLREVVFPIDPVQHAKDVQTTKEHGGNWEEAQRKIYIERIDSPYELYMICDHPSSLKCAAHVYSKKTHFQYGMTFPPEAVEHAGEVIAAINKLIDVWAKK